MSYTVHKCSSAKLRAFLRASAVLIMPSNLIPSHRQTASQFTGGLPKGWNQSRRPNKHRWCTQNARNFAHAHLQTIQNIRAPLALQDLSIDTKFGQSQSRETLPLKGVSHEIDFGKFWYQKNSIKVTVATHSCCALGGWTQTDLVLLLTETGFWWKRLYVKRVIVCKNIPFCRTICFLRTYLKGAWHEIEFA